MQVSTVRSIGTVAAYAVILTSRCLLFLPRILLWTVLPILLHAALRRASSEYLPAKQVGGRKGLSDAELTARMGASPEPATPGVPFSKVGCLSAGLQRSGLSARFGRGWRVVPACVSGAVIMVNMRARATCHVPGGCAHHRAAGVLGISSLTSWIDLL